MIQNKHEIMKHKEFIMSKIKKGLSYYKHKSQPEFLGIEKDVKTSSNNNTIIPLSLRDIMNEKKQRLSIVEEKLILFIIIND